MAFVFASISSAAAQVNFPLTFSKAQKNMAPQKKDSLPSSAPISIGNCEIIVEAKEFKSELNQNSLQISLPRNAKIRISVVEGTGCGKTNNAPVFGTQENGDYYFVLVNPKETDSRTKSLLKEVLDMYSKELPAMNYAANTGKESMFLERCVSNGKYCSLLLKFKGSEGQEEAVSAITYQIVPADTQYAEIPLAAVSSKYQKKGIGCILYMELRKRLQRVGIRTILCWGDNESEGFWLKQGFAVIGEVTKKGRARKLPIKADIRKALCFPGGSTLLVSHLSDSSAHPEELIKLSFPLKLPEQHCSSDIVLKRQQEYIACNLEIPKGLNGIISSTGDSPSDDVTLARFLKDGGYQVMDCLEPANCGNMLNDLGEPKSCEADEKRCSCSGEQTKKRTWEASCTSLRSKKVKGGHTIYCQSDVTGSASGSDVRNNCPSISSAFILGNRMLVDEDTLTNNCLEKNDENCRSDNMISQHHGSCKDLSTEKCFKVMLMNIADNKKKSGLTKIIEDLGGFVTSDGTLCTHVVTGKVRKTLNFCVGLCSGAWIISPSWLKESFRKGGFVEEMPFILNDKDYECKYGTELKLAVLRARAKPNCLLKGYDLCLAAHVQPPVPSLLAIIKSAGGNVIGGLDMVKEPSKAIFIACDEDVEEAILAIKKGTPTFSSDWLMNCIMTQKLDLEASRFAECSL